MNNSISIAIIVVFVVGLLSFLVMAIDNFNDASVLRHELKISEKDSLVNAELSALKSANDSLRNIIDSHNKEIKILNENVSYLKKNIREIASLINN